MNRPRLDELEIVGFNGAALVECGRALPVARRKSDQMFCVLEVRGDGSPLAWHHEEEAKGYAVAQRWTMFTKPLGVPKSCGADGGNELLRQPMVIFVDESLLDMADRVPRPHLWKNDYLMWRRLESSDLSIQAACGSAENVESLLDHWAAGLLTRFDAMFRLSFDRRYLKRIADYALCAARSRSLRWKSYLRYALAQEPDSVRRTFDSFTQREFPEVPWEEFLRKIKELGEVLGAIVAATPMPAAPSCPVPAAPKLRGIATAQPVAMNGSSRR